MTTDRVTLTFALAVAGTAAFAVTPVSAQSLRPHSIAHGGASVAYISSTPSWTIGNDSVTLTVGLAEDGTLRMTTLTSPSAGTVDLRSRPDTFVTIADEVMLLGTKNGLAFLHDEAIERVGGVELALTFQFERTEFFVTRHYAVYGNAPAVEVWTSIESHGDTARLVSNLNAYDLALPPGSVNWISGLQVPDHDNGGAFTALQNDLQPGQDVTIGAQGRASETAVPWWLVDFGSVQLFGGLMWSGAWSARFGRDEAALNVTLGLPDTATQLQPGTPLEMPHAFLGIAGPGREAVSSAMRTFVNDGIRQGRPFEAPVIYNTWFVYGTHVDDEQMREEMKHVADLGVEVFVLDAGWYAGSGDGDPFDFDTALGSWEVDAKRFPDGLGDLAAFAHSLGMRFGLWVEPGRTSFEWLNRQGMAREEWLVTNNGRYDPNKTNDEVKIGQLCFADPRARAWVIDRLTSLIDEIGPDYLKWDNNSWTNCDRLGHGHGPQDGNFQQVEGLYAVLETLRARHPAMLIENVSGGGNLLDFQMLRYSDVGWMDDRSAPSSLVRHNLEGLSLAFPPAYLFSFVMGNSEEPIARAGDLALLARSRMPGVLGLTVRTGELTEAELQGLTDEIATYKRLRPVLRGASTTLLSAQAPRSDLTDWDALQLTSPAGTDAVIFAFSNPEAPERAIVRPLGLDPAARYRVESIDLGEIGVASGADLMSDGIELDDSSISDAHILLLNRQ